jgi:signal peptidase I
MKSKHIIASVLLLVSAATQAANYYVPEDAPPVKATIEAVHIAQALAAKVGGKAALVAATGSMMPTLTAVDIIIYKQVDFDDIKIGNVIIFEAGVNSDYAVCQSCSITHRANSVYAHRVVSNVKGVLTTKGDNNPGVDSFRTTKDKIKGLIMYAVDGQTGVVREL